MSRIVNRTKQVEDFWNRNLCGKRFISSLYPSKEFFEEYRQLRYKKEHHLNYLIDWASAKDKDVLEIGLGIGADGTQWARYAKSYTGIDLTDEAIQATRLHFNHLGLKGSILKADAEMLPITDKRFDIVYSHGVLHHVPNIENALREIFRVLRQNGEVILMLYNKASFNYWVRIQLYFRIRFLFEFLRYKLGMNVGEPWISHIRNLKNKGWLYFSWNNWYHHCTDGPDCEIANIYHSSEIVDMLKKAGFSIKRMHRAHFPIGASPAIENFLGKYIGFYQFVWARKI